MSNADETYQRAKAEKSAYTRQGYSGIKSRIKFRTCATWSCNNTITKGTHCRPCVDGGAWGSHVRHQSQLCPRCKERDIITYGKLCPVCLLKTARARKKDLQKANNLEVVKRMLKDGVKQKATPTRFDNSQYSIERKMLKHRMSLTMPNYKVRRV